MCRNGVSIASIIRAYFIRQDTGRLKKCLLFFSESVFEALPQFSLQLFIILLRFKTPTSLQIRGLVTSLLTLSIAHIKKYIDNHVGKDLEFMDQIKYISKYYPIFALNATFRIASATIAFLFLRSYTIVLLVLYSALLRKILNLYGNYKEVFSKDEFKREQAESLFQSFVTNTNLENSFIAKICRKVTFYFNLVFHILQLLSIYLLSLFVPEDESILFLTDLPLAREKIWLPILIFGVIMIGLLSFFLDLIFCCMECGVFETNNSEDDEVQNSCETIKQMKPHKKMDINSPWRWWWCKPDVEQYLEDNLGTLSLKGIIEKILKEYGRLDNIRPNIFFLSKFSFAVIDLFFEVRDVIRFLTLNPVFDFSFGNDGEDRRGNITSKLFGNAIQQLCVPDYGLNETENQVYNNAICQERHIYFGIITLVLMYTPSVNILSSIYGPCIAGLLSSIWGFILLIVGFVLWTAVANIYQHRILAAFFGVFGFYLIIVGNIHEGKVKSTNNTRNLLRKKGDILLKALVFPVLLIFCPIILLILRLMAALKTSSGLIRNQSENLVLIFKGPTKLCLSLYILFVFGIPGNLLLYLLGIIFLIATNSFTNTVKYYKLEKETWNTGPLEIYSFPYYPIFFTNLLSRALAVSVIMVYYKHQALIPMGVYCWILWRITRYCNLNQQEDKTQFLEASLFGPITVTNLQNTKSSKIFIRISAYLNFVTTTVVLWIILQQENHNNAVFFLDSWYLHLVIWLSIGLGLISFLIDFLYSLLPSWDSVFIQNLRKTTKNDNDNLNDHQSVDKETVIEMSLNHLDRLHEDERELVQGCLNDQKDVNEKGRDGMTALMISAKYDCPDILCGLLLKGAKINLKDKNGKTARTYAIYDDVFGILRNWFNRYWYQPQELNERMLAAAKKGNARLVRGLILVGADMESIYENKSSLDEDKECNGLHIAARLGHDEVVKIFLSLRPGLVESRGYNGMTPLALAVSMRRYSTVKILLDHGAEVDESIVQEAYRVSEESGIIPDGAEVDESIVQEANRESEESGKILELLRLQPLTITATTPQS